MGIVAQPRLRILQTNQMQQLERPISGVLSRQALMDNEGLADLLCDRVKRVQRRHRFLKNHTDHAPSYLEEFAIVSAHHLNAINGDATGRMIRKRIGQQLQDRERCHGFPRTAFSD